MNKADKFKLLYIFGISLIFFFTGCVDTSVQNIPSSFDFHSQVKIVNLSSNGGAATINVFDVTGAKVASVSSLNVGDEYPGNGQAFLDLQAGSKTFIITYANAPADTFKQVTDTDLRMRFFIVDVNDTTRNIVKSVERYTWQQKNTANGKALFPSDSTSIMFFNSSDVTVAKIIVKSTSPAVDTTITASLTNGKGFHYTMFKAPGNYTVSFWSASDSLASVSFSPQVQSRYSTVLYGSSIKNTLQSKVFTDD